MNPFAFTITATDGRARCGEVQTAHGTFATPVFMATATAATVKAMLPESVRATGAELAIANTYHLMLRPGDNAVQALGGLHRFMNWSGPIVTDSGGFQVMSLASLRTLREQGVQFRSHIDGKAYELTPERSARIQENLGSDIAMCFDECTPYPATHEEAAASMRLSMRWAARCKTAFRPRLGHALFGIVQGSIYPDLRTESANALKNIDFEGYGIGGLAVGEGQTAMLATLDETVPQLPNEKPRYLMGVGKPDDIVQAVIRGVDMFDCVMPTRSGRTGQAFTKRGTLNMRNARHAHDPRPLEEGCACPLCQGYTRAYLHHLFRCGEMLGPMLLSWHNLHYYQDLIKKLRQAIRAQTLQDFVAGFLAIQEQGDADPVT